MFFWIRASRIESVLLGSRADFSSYLVFYSVVGHLDWLLIKILYEISSVSTRNWRDHSAKASNVKIENWKFNYSFIYLISQEVVEYFVRIRALINLQNLFTKGKYCRF